MKLFLNIEQFLTLRMSKDNQIKKFKFIKKIIPQDDPDYSKNLTLLKPDYVVHGDDWIEGIKRNTDRKLLKF